MGFLYLAGACIANGIANVLLKMGATRGISFDWSQGLLKLVSHHGFLIAGILLFAGNVILYVLALRALPLSLAYPIMVAMTFIIVNVASIMLFDEQVTTTHVIGYVLILAGVACVVGLFR